MGDPVPQFRNEEFGLKEVAEHVATVVESGSLGLGVSYVNHKLAERREAAKEAREAAKKVSDG